MEGEIKNRVAESKLITFDLEDFYPEGKRLKIDISQFLIEGILLKEKDFREQVKSHNWKQYQDCYIALTNINEAIIPAWAFMLLTTQLTSFAKKVTVGSLAELEMIIFIEILSEINITQYTNKLVIIKGCANKPIPENAYIKLTQVLQPVVKSLMYGEACSSVPLFKRKS